MKKTRGRKSRDTVSLRRLILWLSIFFFLFFNWLLLNSQLKERPVLYQECQMRQNNEAK
jgi:hypothetical protein